MALAKNTAIQKGESAVSKGFCKKIEARKSAVRDQLREEMAQMMSREHQTPIAEVRKAIARFPYIYKVNGSFVTSMEPPDTKLSGYKVARLTQR
jgi:hypothetical protein